MPDQTPDPFTAGPASSYVPVVAELAAERDQLAAQLAAIRDLAKLWTRDPNAPEHDCGVDILKTLSRFDGGTAQPDEEVRRAVRRLCARIVANAHLLDVPFTNAPHLSPWTQLKRDMTALYEAVGIRFAEPPAGRIEAAKETRHA